jgi:hypothetical protein
MIEMFNPQRSEVGENQSRKPRKLSGKGPDESSPVRSAGLAYFKRRRPGGTIEWLLVLLKSTRDQEPNVSIVPCPESFRGLRDGHLFFASFPSTSYWATFTKSLRDESSAHTPNPYVDAHGRLPDLYQRRCPRFASFSSSEQTETGSLGVKSDDSFNQKPRADQRTK